MLSTKNYNNNSGISANLGTFDNLTVNNNITNTSLNNNLNSISGQIQ